MEPDYISQMQLCDGKSSGKVRFVGSYLRANLPPVRSLDDNDVVYASDTQETYIKRGNKLVQIGSDVVSIPGSYDGAEHRCEYCGTRYYGHQTHCESCGAPL